MAQSGKASAKAAKDMENRVHSDLGRRQSLTTSLPANLSIWTGRLHDRCSKAIVM